MQTDGIPHISATMAPIAGPTNDLHTFHSEGEGEEEISNTLNSDKGDKKLDDNLVESITHRTRGAQQQSEKARGELHIVENDENSISNMVPSQ